MSRRKTLPEPVLSRSRKVVPVMVPEPVPVVAVSRRKKAAVVLPPPIVVPVKRRRVRKVVAAAAEPPVAPKPTAVPVAPKAGKPNAWIAHVKSVAKEKGLTMKDAMKAAKETYKK